jgi:hypothetical protein
LATKPGETQLTVEADDVINNLLRKLTASELENAQLGAAIKGMKRREADLVEQITRLTPAAVAADKD